MGARRGVFEAASVALTGDSAGGNMALATAVRAREAGLPQPAAIAVFSPALDLAAEGESHATDAPLLVRPLMDLFNAIYIGDGDLRSPKVTPFYSDLSGLPPTLVHVGSWEILRDDTVTMAERIKAAGVKTELKLWDGMSTPGSSSRRCWMKAWPRSWRPATSSGATSPDISRLTRFGWEAGGMTLKIQGGNNEQLQD